MNTFCSIMFLILSFFLYFYRFCVTFIVMHIVKRNISIGFIDGNVSPLINEEQKVRIAKDMNVFGTSKDAAFINLVFNGLASVRK